MTALADVEHRAAVDDGADVAVLLGGLGKREQTVEVGQQVGVDLYLRNKLLHGQHQLVEELCFERQNLVLGTENLLLVLLQLLGDVALGLGQRLLAHPFLRHQVLIRITHFQVVAEDVIVAYLQALYARQLGLALLNLQQVVLAAVGNVAQLVELLVHTVADDAALLHQLWRVGLNLALNTVAERLAEIQPLANALQGVVLGVETGRLDGVDGLQGRLQLDNLARRNAPHGHLRDDALEVANAVQLLVDTLAELRLAVVILHNVQALVDGPLVLQREHEPAAQQAAAHRRDRLVDHIEQRLAVFLHGLNQL